MTNGLPFNMKSCSPTEKTSPARATSANNPAKSRTAQIGTDGFFHCLRILNAFSRNAHRIHRRVRCLCSPVEQTHRSCHCGTSRLDSLRFLAIYWKLVFFISASLFTHRDSSPVILAGGLIIASVSKVRRRFGLTRFRFHFIFRAKPVIRASHLD